MRIKTFNVSFPSDFADKIDIVAKQHFGSRSDLLRTAALKYIRDEEKFLQFKELIQDGKTFTKASPLKTEEEVAEHITIQRRKKESWR